jgi:hypothetical protein
LVFNALQRRLDAGPKTEKQELALYALRHWIELHGSAQGPSRRQYDAFREAQRVPGSWPSSTLIRKAFGSWEAARATAEGRPLPDATVRRLTATGTRFSADEVKQGLVAWADGVADDQPLLQDDFLLWCRKQLAARETPFERLPLTDNTIRAALGGWPEALAAIGQLQRRNRGPAAQGKQSTSNEIGQHLQTAPISRTVYSPAELAAWLRWAAARRGGDPERSLSAKQYEEIRAAAEGAAVDGGRVLRMPSSTTLVHRFSGWQKAQVAAGLVDGAESELPERKAYERRELVGSVRRASAAVGNKAGGVDQPTYERWRARELARRRKRDPRSRIPSSAVLRQRLGGPGRRWAAVVRTALSDDDPERGRK